MKPNTERTLASLTLIASSAFATNGDNLIGIGPISRSLGGVGVAAPQDAITTITANPASLGFAPSSSDLGPVPASLEPVSSKSPKSPKGVQPVTPESDTDSFSISSTVFLPHVSAQVDGVSADGKDKTYVIPAIAWTHLIGGPQGKWGVGLAAFGSSGFGVDYRDTALNNSRYYNFSGTAAGPFAPLTAGQYTYLSFLKIEPAVSYRFSDQWSFGVAGHINYGGLDLGNTKSNDWGFGWQPGLTFRPIETVSFGLSYTSAQTVRFKNVTDFNGDGKLDTLKLEQPQQVSFGASTGLLKQRLLLETNVKWINWGGADGYNDFGRKDSWVVGVGAQYQLVPGRLALRVGYNYGTNPIKEDRFNGGFNPANTTNVQGKSVPNYYYESFRTVGMPAVVEHHVTAGFGYRITKQLALNLGYTHAFQNSITSAGSNLFGRSSSITSSLSEDSIEAGFDYKF